MSGMAAVMAARSREVRHALAATASQRDRDAARLTDEAEVVRKSGIGALLVPSVYGGAGLGFHALADAVTQLAAGDPSVAQSLQPHFIFLERVRLMGSELQRRRYLRAASEGMLFGNATSEIGVPSGEWTATLRRADGSSNGWRLDGRKFYSTGTAIAEQTFVGVIDEQGQRALAIVPVQRAGVQLGDDWRVMGQRATASGSVTFDNVQVTTDEVISLSGWETRRHHTGSGSQIIHCAIDAGIAAAALDDAVQFARQHARATRESGKERAADDPLVQQTIGHIAADAFAAEAAVLEAGRRIDIAAQALYALQEPGGHAEPASRNTDDVDRLLVDASIATAQAKIISTRAALRACEQLFEVGGASASASRFNLDRHWRNARTHTLHDPLGQKFIVIGNHLLNGAPPPITFTY